MADTPASILKRYWGFVNFRPLQEQVIQAVMDGRDTLALMPTGGGKSICFQVPALCGEGLCLVISPLIALMKDQVQNLQKRNIPASAIYSGMHIQDIDRTFDNCIYGNIKLLYLSPERLVSELAQERIKKMNVNLIAVDEAHCISQWGYDFRPSYLEIANIRKLLPTTPVLALTATATKEVVKDIQEKLAFRKKNVLRKSFTRDKLAYVVLNEEGKLEKLLDILKKVKGTGIIYVRNRRKTKEIAYYLQKRGIAADYYHAGLEPSLRSRKQELWNAGELRIIVSTNAFGMGIDKAEVRVVVHMELPDSLEAYFQEAGRAGRDGKKAYSVLLYNQSDPKNLERNYELAFPEMEEIKQVYRALGSYFQLAVGAGKGQSLDFDIIEFSQNFKLGIIKTLNSLKILEQAGWMALTEAVFVPSSLKIQVSKDELYDYQLQHPKLDKVIKTILRTYQGAFHNFINLREQQLAKFLNIPKEELSKTLALLSKDGIINYLPQKEKPQIIFLQERMDASNISIDRKLYRFRKSRYHYRIKKAIAYAETNICRSQQLLSYFDETDAPLCGICDVCLGRTKGELDKETFERLKIKIWALLAKESLSLEELVESFSPRQKNQLIKTLEYLLDEGFLEKVDDKFVWEGPVKS